MAEVLPEPIPPKQRMFLEASFISRKTFWLGAKEELCQSLASMPEDWPINKENVSEGKGFIGRVGLYIKETKNLIVETGEQRKFFMGIK